MCANMENTVRKKGNLSNIRSRIWIPIIICILDRDFHGSWKSTYISRCNVRFASCECSSTNSDR